MTGTRSLIAKLVGVILIGAALLTPVRAQAQVELGPSLAFHDDFDLGVGAVVGVGLPSLAEGVGFLGDFTLFFPDADNVDYWELNGNVTWDIPVEATAVAPFVLGGLNLARASADVSGGGDVSDTQLGLNLGGGIRFETGALEPIVGVKVELSGGEGGVLWVALPFDLGP